MKQIDKPPILADGEISKALSQYWVQSKICKKCGSVRHGSYMLSPSERDNEVAKAQRDADYQWAITDYRAEVLKEALVIVDKFWKQYCNFSDTKSCLEILGDIHNGIEALSGTMLEKEKEE